MNATKDDIGKLVMCDEVSAKFGIAPSRKGEPHGPYRIESMNKQGDIVLVHTVTGEKHRTSGRWIHPIVPSPTQATP